MIWFGLRLQVWTEKLDDQPDFTTDQSQKVSMKCPLQIFSFNTCPSIWTAGLTKSIGHLNDLDDKMNHLVNVLLGIVLLPYGLRIVRPVGDGDAHAHHPCLQHLLPHLDHLGQQSSPSSHESWFWSSEPRDGPLELNHMQFVILKLKQWAAMEHLNQTCIQFNCDRTI